MVFQYICKALCLGCKSKSRSAQGLNSGFSAHTLNETINAYVYESIYLCFDHRNAYPSLSSTVILFAAHEVACYLNSSFKLMSSAESPNSQTRFTKYVFIVHNVQLLTKYLLMLLQIANIKCCMELLSLG